MGQTYNITMKHFNGVDYDTLLPVSVKMEKVEYAGNGLYGENNPTSVTFSAEPQLVLLPNRGVPSETYLWSNYYSDQGFIPTDLISTTYKKTSSSGVYIKKSADGKTFTWYSSNNADDQSNAKKIGGLYFCYGIFF